jgi:putative PIN family toxin of toxin-antitoxin system
LRVVFDTNIYVSALTFPEGRAEEALRLAVARRCVVLISSPLLVELSRVLRDKFTWDEDRILDANRRIAEIAERVTPGIALAELRDGADNRVLECAVAGGAAWMVTGDRDLLELKQFRGIRIRKLSEFLRVFL